MAAGREGARAHLHTDPAALTAAKARGVILGKPKLHAARMGAVDIVKAEADRFAANVLPTVCEAQNAGARA